MINKKEIKKIIKDKTGYCKESKYNYDYETITKFGFLLVGIHDNSNSIFTRFDNPELVEKSIVDCNRHSGKYNFHFRTKEENLQKFGEFLDKVRDNAGVKL